MTGLAPQPIRWTRRRWITTCAVLLAVQVGLIFYFGERSHPLPRALRLRTALHFAVDEWSSQQLDQLSAISDPALFALPSLDGFSGKAWLTFQKPAYQLNNWSNPPVWLSLNAARLGADFSKLVQTNLLPVAGFTAKSAPDLTATYIPVPPPPSPVASELRVEGAEPARTLAAPLELRSWAQEEVLSNSVVQVMVDRAGNTLSARLLESSGSKPVDDYALERASKARFKAAPQQARVPWSFQRLVFQWYTIAPGQTNSLSAGR
ncbi:MAG TPA: energy transducer TonB [Verrucomicrobiae bacterium]|nr:energy transducer TonB [Verrucomicrobiae bacterium]